MTSVTIYIYVNLIIFVEYDQTKFARFKGKARQYEEKQRSGWKWHKWFWNQTNELMTTLYLVIYLYNKYS